MKNETLPVLHETTKTFSGGQKVLGRYKLVRVLGQGGMGIVWLARDEELEREIALKFLPSILVNDRASLEELKRETRRSLDLTHPNIVRTYDFVQDGAIAGISMEYVDSDTLRNKRIDQPNGVFEPAVMGDWVRQLCSALDYAHHQARIVHRDLKPANLMVNGRNQLKVADFGISRSLAESTTQLTGMGMSSGTLVYMSPQQLLGDEPTALDDVYGVGATLYELLTTRPPFYTGDISGQITKKAPPSIRDRRAALGVTGAELPSRWEETIATCLAKDPSQRPQSAGEIAVRLGLVDAASISKPPPLAPGARPSIQQGDAARLGAAASPPPASAPIAPVHTKSSKPILLAGLAVAAIAAALGTWHFGAKPTPAGQGRNLHSEVVSVSSTPTAAAKEEDHGDTEEQKRIEAERLANARGSVVIQTEPPGATVKIGDSPAKKSPAVINNLKVGQQSVEITLEGYEPVDKTVDVAADKATDLKTITLERIVGSLRIGSNPENLKFRLKSETNAINQEENFTPWTREKLPIGKYSITLNRDGWKSETHDVTITKDHETVKIIDMIGGNVTINSKPTGAKVLQDGKELEGVTPEGKPTKVTPLTLKDVSPGEREYTLRKDKLASATFKVKVMAGEDIATESIVLKTSSVRPPVEPETVKKAEKSGPKWYDFVRPGGGIPIGPHPMPSMPFHP